MSVPSHLSLLHIPGLQELRRAAQDQDLQFVLHAAAQGQELQFVPRAAVADFSSRIYEQSAPHGIYLTGPGGVGKSSILFMIAASVLAREWERQTRARRRRPRDHGDDGDGDDKAAGTSATSSIVQQRSPQPRLDVAADAAAVGDASSQGPFAAAAETAAISVYAAHTISASVLEVTPPVLVLYIVDTAELVEMSPEDAAKRLCNTLGRLNASLMQEFSQLAEILNGDGTALGRWAAFQGFLEDSYILRLLILVDQWNALVARVNDPAFPTDHPMRSFSTIASSIGFSFLVTAVSSSFSAVTTAHGVFCDDEAICWHVRVFRSDEARICRHHVVPLTLNDIWRSRPSPVEVDDATIAELHEMTGGIPRLCEYFAEARVTNPAADINGTWQQSCLHFYRERLFSLQRQTYRDPECASWFRGDLASVLLRNAKEPIPFNTHSSYEWLNAGLMMRDATGHLVPINRFINVAAELFFQQEKQSFLRMLYLDRATSWRALELFVQTNLRSGGFVLTGTTLRGEVRPPLESISRMNVVIVDESFARDPAAFLQARRAGESYPPGTLFIPGWSQYTVVDAVLYLQLRNHQSPCLIFVQVSQLLYGNHRYKLPDLVREKFGWTLTVLDSYKVLCGLTNDAAFAPAAPSYDIAQGTLPPRIYYVYVTADDSLMRRGQVNSNHDVLLMRPSNLAQLDSETWAEITRG
ncbi:hypothetical protein CAOG_02969 [Capsaspora owczarzaki ATCC 30864]|uniref:Uncharacterized protein n=1 Tax=Capsaspora owczarzaki (strain ATCC 30864) TaxID=595528 RepID=A0A0D2WNE2_CAPO3|nr:hypothetical protein CAOG_02969 [Capsaspora owczarzaki ATCC 30864]KJE91908.1 hypothetical protein CAOG_002969 [Capsaspora owczarzaki ATCC 30864]|eukprot:XP_004363808.2 hypothetical protein CAOG_02969 [Capsaspora owczarzaki ATCC 30864]